MCQSLADFKNTLNEYQTKLNNVITKYKGDVEMIQENFQDEIELSEIEHINDSIPIALQPIMDLIGQQVPINTQEFLKLTKDEQEVLLDHINFSKTISIYFDEGEDFHHYLSQLETQFRQ